MMKYILSILLVTAVFLTATSAIATPPKEKGGSTDQIIAKIKKYREAGEAKIRENKFTRKEVSFENGNVKESIKQKWARMDAYYDGDRLVRIQLYPHQGISGRTEEFYLMNDKLVFAFIQDKGPKHEGRDMGEPGKEFYFDNGKLLQMEDRSGEPNAHADQEKKMYETRLPYEIAELLDILKQK